MLNEYYAPPEEMCRFLEIVFPKITNKVEGEGQDLAKRLLDLYDGKNKRYFHTNHICDAFPWMVQVGILTYRNVYTDRGGWRLMLRRTGTDEDALRAFTIRPTVIHGIVRWPEGTPARSVAETKKKCCENPHPVRSKKTGKRKCKNCGKKLKSKKSSAPS